MQFRSNYWDDESAKASFIEFTKTIHNLDLSLWDEAGYWDDNFAPFSYFLDGEIISSVCVYLLPMRVNGRDCKVPQVSSVATVDAYRGQGLNRQLTGHALDWCQQQGAADFSFLFADEDAFGFYRKCGWRHAPQSRVRVNVPDRAKSQLARKLDVTRHDDLDLIERIARQRVPVSDKLGAWYSNLLMFHSLYTVQDFAYALPGAETIVFASASDSVLHLFDVVSGELPELDRVLEALPITGFSQVQFGFMPDKFVSEFECELEADCGTHLLGSMPLEDSCFRFPFTSQA